MITWYIGMGGMYYGDMAAGDRPATDDEVAAREALLNGPKAKLAQLDAENTLTQRNLRETIMLMSEAFKQVTGGVLDISSIPGVAKVYEIEQQAAQLRTQL